MSLVPLGYLVPDFTSFLWAFSSLHLLLRP
jgi:hypothetical protein